MDARTLQGTPLTFLITAVLVSIGAVLSFIEE